MISKIKKLILCGFRHYSGELGTPIEKIQYVIFLGKDGSLIFWLYKDLNPVKEITFWQAVDLEGKIHFIDYETLASNFIKNKIDGYVKADGIKESDIRFMIRYNNDITMIIVYNGKESIDTFELDELFA